MAQRPFRFLHASDFRLDRPIDGLAEVPEALRKVCIEAPYRAAEKVIDAALAEQADFLVLSGDVLQADLTGPAGPLFLIRQFERLRARNIPVYWAGGQTDPPESWPVGLALPDNVRVFPASRPSEWTHERDGAPLARITGCCRGSGRIRPEDFWPDPSGLFTVAAAHGAAVAEALAARPLQYWALGGQTERETIQTDPAWAHYPGSPQGRRPAEAGAHGCTLVQVAGDGRARLASIATDVLRFVEETAVIDEETTAAGLELMLRERLSAAIASAPGIDLAVSWRITGYGPLTRPLRTGGLAATLLAALRRDFFGAEPPRAWSLSLAVAPADRVPAPWLDRDSLLGEFLRTVRELEESRGADPLLDLPELLSAGRRSSPVGQAVAIADPAARELLLREAAALGADLLCAEESER
jgi:hypothetical protein